MLLLALAGRRWAQAEKLGVGDAVRVTVFQQPDLTTEARINERGTIADAADRRGQGRRACRRPRPAAQIADAAEGAAST